MYCGWLRPAIGDADLDEEVLSRVLGIFHKNIEVAIFVEDSGIQEFIFHVATIPLSVLLNQIAVGESRLRILVQVLHVGVSGRAVEVEVVFLSVFAVVCLAVRQAENTFLQYRILAVPQTDAEAEPLFVIADSGQTILAPVISAGTGLVMSEVVPGISIVTVVL